MAAAQPSRRPIHAAYNKETKQSNESTSADPFAFASSGHNVPYGPNQHVAEFLLWCVRKYIPYLALPLSALRLLYVPESAYLFCPITAAFSPQSTSELVKAVESCLQLSPQGECSNDPHGPIGEWDVSSVTDMSRIFSEANSFTGDISKWDVSGVTTMAGMFHGAASFNGDISKWECRRQMHARADASLVPEVKTS